eukprot:CCRYP_010790-RA/>CCRYP_010790-RA protein AED:0.42 eAED:0.60 QI:0/0/0/1/0/0/2/0/76
MGLLAFASKAEDGKGSIHLSLFSNTQVDPNSITAATLLATGLAPCSDWIEIIISVSTQDPIALEGDIPTKIKSQRC